LVKNVTGYDLPRLATGSMGSLGFISSVCLKLWPMPRSTAIVSVPDPARAHADLFRPFAVVETERRSMVVLEGSEADIERQTASVGGTRFEGELPGPLPHTVVVSVRVPTGAMADAIAEVRSAGADAWVGQHGIGIVEAGWDRFDRDDLIRLRSGVGRLEGIVVINRADDTFMGVDRWGTALQAPAIQRRLKNQFDPAGVCNPGVLPGGL
jgi:glycolate oxidase FAD binding subunit